MSEDPTGLLKQGSIKAMAHQLMETFSAKATPADILELAQLVKEAREVEHKADAAKEAISANRDVALATLALRDRLLAQVVARRLDRTDRAVDALVSKLESTEDPAQIAALAGAISEVATSDQFSDVAEMVAALRSDRIELEF